MRQPSFVKKLQPAFQANALFNVVLLGTLDDVKKVAPFCEKSSFRKYFCSIVRGGRKDVILYFLKDIGISASPGRPYHEDEALFVAVEFGIYEIAKILLEYGAYKDYEIDGHHDALSHAIRMDKEKFDDRRARPSFSGDKKTPFEVARFKMVQLLLKYNSPVTLEHIEWAEKEATKKIVLLLKDAREKQKNNTQ